MARTSVVLGIRLTSSTSTSTFQPPSERSRPTTPSGSLPVSSTSCRAASAAVRPGFGGRWAYARGALALFRGAGSFFADVFFADVLVALEDSLDALLPVDDEPVVAIATPSWDENEQPSAARRARPPGSSLLRRSAHLRRVDDRSPRSGCGS